MKFQDIIADYLIDKGFIVRIWDVSPHNINNQINFYLNSELTKNNQITHYCLIPKDNIVELRRKNLKVRNGNNQFYYEPENILILKINIYDPNDIQSFYDWVEELMIKTKISRG